MPFDPTIDYYWLGETLRDLALGAGSTLSALDNTMNCLRPPYLEDADPDFMDLLKKLQGNSEKLLKETIRNIRNHPFFRGINWEEVEAKETRPPFFVRRKGLRHIRRQKIPLDDLLDDEDITDEMQMLFDGFSFESDQWRAIQKLN
ncbi:serine/threonine-protein kinase Sgk1-like [Rana temporaria]|uniref:serine/threonine-protein kinase Sgk1-like n=1 Tax=Rana temporaria TaxID=8407 RepID=UPI001AAD88C2|nr:serine/threonine-protein kinase Sgk1-like [Rana temporaria]